MAIRCLTMTCFCPRLSKAIKTMLAAISGSTMLDATCTHPSSAAVRLMLCAMVKLVSTPSQ